MGRFKTWVANTFFRDIMVDAGTPVKKSSSSNTEIVSAKTIGIRFGDVTSKDFEAPEFDLSQIKAGADTDSYIRQGIDKYIDQIFKEGFDFYGKDTNVVDYVKLRLHHMGLVTGIPTEQFFVDVAEDVVKYSNAILVKARLQDPSQLPQGVSIAGLNGAQPVVGYFSLNPTTIQVKRDKNGTILGWQQQVEGADKPAKFKPEDVVHIPYKKEKGNAFGTPFLLPVLDDVRALRQAEENVLRMIYRNIYPFYHVQVGSQDMPGQEKEIDKVKNDIDQMDVEAGLVTSNRVEIKAIASDKVINAEPYLRYLEERVFSGMGIPGILFGRGGTANRSTGDNMTSEMADRIKAIQKTIELHINFSIISEILREGGYDPVLNPDQMVFFRFKENDLDTKIKSDTHAIYMYQNNAIDEDEMRNELGRDPITAGRSKMFLSLVTLETLKQQAALKPNTSNSSSSSSTASKQTQNKQKPQNQHGTKTSPKKSTNSSELINLIDEILKE